MSLLQSKPRILYSCYHARSWQGEQFIPEHIFSYHVSGTMLMNNGNKSYNFAPGSFRLSRRNKLMKFFKEPPPNGDFKMLSVFLDQPTLRNFALEYGYEAVSHQDGEAMITLQPHPLLQSYVASLQPYEQFTAAENVALIDLKIKELLLILLQTNPELKQTLFDFSEPGKIDLEAFMNRNFHFNVNLERFAYLTGRSLATFKRDFERIFHISPARWLMQKRLQEARYRIKEQGKAPSDVYLDLGFEDLSHFSFAFKKQFGIAPSRI